MLEYAFYLTGVIGLVLIIFGLFSKKRYYEDLLFAFGGIFLLFYSISKKDYVFIVLQIVFIIASFIEYFKNRRG